MMLILCMGLAFELPLVTWLLSLLGIVNKSFLRKYRRHAVVVIVIAAAIITPTGDPFTLSVVAIPLYLLYEMSILMIKDKKEERYNRRSLNIVGYLKALICIRIKIYHVPLFYGSK